MTDLDPTPDAQPDAQPDTAAVSPELTEPADPAALDPARCVHGVTGDECGACAQRRAAAAAVGLPDVAELFAAVAVRCAVCRLPIHGLEPIRLAADGALTHAEHAG